ncbi:F-box-like protein [Cinnamomum micranthum f. kanehirae]|uniref:F-box-like protein n=1 Tax=Cinnamomum micranthum f. kanehirae TaxID=337451 RepID=A0A443NJM8_9MAGN|nr:F-box-like protein [Cinnamomum micranthum f. kanehirae]
MNVWHPQGGRSGAIECLYYLETSLQNLCHVRVLKLSTNCIQALSLRELQNLPPLIFKHRHLILETGPTKWELPGIVYLLKNSPDLETLSVKIEESKLCYDLSMVLGEEFEFDETEYWESFISPLSYVVHYLKTIKIWDAASELNLALRITSEASLRNEENGVRFLNFFIKSAIHLEKLTCITKPNFKGIHDIARMMGALPGAFSSAEILVCL